MLLKDQNLKALSLGKHFNVEQLSEKSLLL